MKSRIIFLSLILLFLLSCAKDKLLKQLTNPTPSVTQISTQFEDETVTGTLGSANVQLTGQGEIYYTTDGTDPKKYGVRYDKPFTLKGVDWTDVLKEKNKDKNEFTESKIYEIKYFTKRNEGFSFNETDVAVEKVEIKSSLKKKQAIKPKLVTTHLEEKYDDSTVSAVLGSISLSFEGKGEIYYTIQEDPDVNPNPILDPKLYGQKYMGAIVLKGKEWTEKLKEENKDKDSFTTEKRYKISYYVKYTNGLGIVQSEIVTEDVGPVKNTYSKNKITDADIKITATPKIDKFEDDTVNAELGSNLVSIDTKGEISYTIQDTTDPDSKEIDPKLYGQKYTGPITLKGKEWTEKLKEEWKNKGGDTYETEAKYIIHYYIKISNGVSIVEKRGSIKTIDSVKSKYIKKSLSEPKIIKETKLDKYEDDTVTGSISSTLISIEAKGDIYYTIQDLADPNSKKIDPKVYGQKYIGPITLKSKEWTDKLKEEWNNAKDSPLTYSTEAKYKVYYYIKLSNGIGTLEKENEISDIASITATYTKKALPEPKITKEAKADKYEDDTVTGSIGSALISIEGKGDIYYTIQDMSDPNSKKIDPKVYGQKYTGPIALKSKEWTDKLKEDWNNAKDSPLTYTTEAKYNVYYYVKLNNGIGTLEKYGEITDITPINAIYTKKTVGEPIMTFVKKINKYEDETVNGDFENGLVSLVSKGEIYYTIQDLSDESKPGEILDPKLYGQRYTGPISLNGREWSEKLKEDWKIKDTLTYETTAKYRIYYYIKISSGITNIEKKGTIKVDNSEDIFIKNKLTKKSFPEIKITGTWSEVATDYNNVTAKLKNLLIKVETKADFYYSIVDLSSENNQYPEPNPKLMGQRYTGPIPLNGKEWTEKLKQIWKIQDTSTFTTSANYKIKYYAKLNGAFCNLEYENYLERVNTGTSLDDMKVDNIYTKKTLAFDGTTLKLEDAKGNIKVIGKKSESPKTTIFKDNTLKIEKGMTNIFFNDLEAELYYIVRNVTSNDFAGGASPIDEDLDAKIYGQRYMGSISLTGPEWTEKMKRYFSETTNQTKLAAGLSEKYILNYYFKADSPFCTLELSFKSPENFVSNKYEVLKISPDNVSGAEGKYTTNYIDHVSEVTFNHNLISLKSAKGASIYYTIDGSDPKTNGRRYDGPIDLRYDGWNETKKGTLSDTKQYTIKYYEKFENESLILESEAKELPKYSTSIAITDKKNLGNPTINRAGNFATISITPTGAGFEVFAITTVASATGITQTTIATPYSGPISILGSDGNPNLKVWSYFRYRGLYYDYNSAVVTSPQ